MTSEEIASSFKSSSHSVVFSGDADFSRHLQNELVEAKRIFVLGFGHAWKSDDRLGVALVEKLKKNLGKKDNIRIVSGGEVPENYTGAVRAFSPSHVILLDAMDAGYEPGTIFMADQDSIVVQDMTSHHLPLKMLINYLSRSIGCRVILIGIQPQTMAAGEKLSKPVKAAITKLMKLLLKILAPFAGS